MDDAISGRLVAQRLRNRVMEALEILADGDEGLRAVGAQEYFSDFFDFVDDDAPHDWRALSTYTDEEVALIDAVLVGMLAALESTASLRTEEAIATTGWPERIAPIAREALAVMAARGRFDEEREEPVPSHR